MFQLFGASAISNLMNVSAFGTRPPPSNLMNVSAFGAPEFSDLMNVSEKEIHVILNAAVLPVLLCCCAAKLCKYQEILKDILRIPLQILRKFKGNLKDAHANLKEF